MAELERLHSHLLRAGVATELIGFETLFMHAFRMREQVMDSLETISGNRVNYSMNRIGGVNRDIGDPDAVLFSVRSIRDDRCAHLHRHGLTNDPGSFSRAGWRPVF